MLFREDFRDILKGWALNEVNLDLCSFGWRLEISSI
jgi:hypothetical protein